MILTDEAPGFRPAEGRRADSHDKPRDEVAAHPEFQRKSPVAEGLLGFRRAAPGARDLIRIGMDAVTAGLPPQGKGKPISRINPEKLRETMAEQWRPL